MNIAYFSPFLPDPSGISDFSEELVMELKKYINIDLFARIEPSSENIKENFKVFNIDDIEKPDIRNKYDLLVYQAGNNVRFHKKIMDMFMKYPGVLEIHDFAMHHFLAEDTYAKGDYENYIKIMEYCHGQVGKCTAEKFLQGQILAPWDNQSQKFTVNKHFIDNAKAIIVHSDMAKQMVLGIRPESIVINIPLHTTDIKDEYYKFKLKCKEKLNISKNKMVFGSFGYATMAKRIVPILHALSQLDKEDGLDFVYFIVGKLEDKNIVKEINKLKLKKRVVVTGFVELDDFKKYMGACDICFNLRYPTQGESSASLHRIIGMGKPVLVTNIGTFEEYPEDIVFKIRHDDYEIGDIVRTVRQFIKDPDRLELCGKQAIEYARQYFCLEKNARIYADFFESVVNNTYVEKDIYDKVLNQLFLENDAEDVTVDLVIKKLQEEKYEGEENNDK